MAQARLRVLPPQAAGTYHLLSRCNRQQFLLGGKFEHRRAWVAGMLARLLDGFAIDLHAFAIMSNHVHLVVRPRPDKSLAWLTQDVAARGLAQIPIRIGAGLEAVPVTPALTEHYAQNEEWVAEHRLRLSSLAWFMKLFKQRIARRANAEDDCRGHFWESRFLSIPLLDNGAVIGCMAYIDRNPLRAKLATDPADANFTSIAHRLSAAGVGQPSSYFCAEDRRLGAHLTPLVDCRPVDPLSGSQQRGGLTLSEYAAIIATGKPSGEAIQVCTQLGFDPQSWSKAQGEGGRFQGVAIGTRASRAAFAQTLGKKIVADKTGVWSK